MDELDTGRTNQDYRSANSLVIDDCVLYFGDAPSRDCNHERGGRCLMDVTTVRRDPKLDFFFLQSMASSTEGQQQAGRGRESLADLP